MTVFGVLIKLGIGTVRVHLCGMIVVTGG